MIKINLKNKSLGRTISSNINRIYNSGKEKIIFKNHKKFIQKKCNSKIYKHYTGFPGGLVKNTYGFFYKNFPKKIIFNCIKGMLKKNRKSRKILSRLVFD
ncbi:uL13 family ribosomal protein [Candidatus Vidania fulgoroideorum]